MVKREIVVKEKNGLHARPATLLVQLASKYEDEITINYKEKKGSLKSIMMVMSLGVPQGEEFEIVVDGDNSESIFAEIDALLKEHKVI
jgi:phosphocarrier protein